jgi:hypothetical protein
VNAILASYFGYPYGAVWSNLIASAICALTVWWRVRARMAVHHAEGLARAAQQHAERLAQADRHHEAMMSHVSAVGSRVATASAAVPQKLLEDIAKTRRRPPGPPGSTGPTGPAGKGGGG